MTLRILYFGLPLGALHLQAHGISPVAVCSGHRAAPGWRRLRRGSRPDRLLLVGRQLDAPPLRALLQSLHADAILSFFYPRAIPDSLIESVPRGAFGTHPSLLPALRGPDPYFWAIYHGFPSTGVTLHRLTADYDAGSIVAQREVPVAPTDTAWSLARKLDRPALDLLVDCARRLEAGEALEGHAQDPRRVTQAPQPTSDQLRIDWRKSSETIERLVRAAAPDPGATALLGDTLVVLLRVRVSDNYPRALQPGEAWIHRDVVGIRTGNSAVIVEAAREVTNDRRLRGRALAALLAAPHTRLDR